VSTSTSQRLDAARKEAGEARQALSEAHVALAHLTRAFLSFYATLAVEAHSPSRTSPDLGVIIHTGGSKSRPPASNHAAIRELRRIDAQLRRIGQRGLGDATGHGGRLDDIVHGHDRDLV
jgi:hypothetical protein